MFAVGLHTDAVYAHTGPDGLVWTTAGSTEQTPGEFARRSRHVYQVRLFGCAANAALGVALTAAGVKVQVLPAVAAQGEPAVMCGRLWARAAIGASWLPLRASDLPAWKLAASVQASGGRVDVTALQLLRQHPACVAVTFPAGYDLTAAARWLAAVVDVRLFTDPTRPHRINRLAAFLGMAPANATARMAGRAGGRHAARFADVVESWSQHIHVGGRGEFPGHDFTRRGRDSRALLYACRRYLRFVRDVWLFEVGGRRQEGFTACEFFRSDPAAAVSYEAHRARNAAT